MRMYSDEPIKVGARLELDLFLPGDEAIRFLARVVWVDELPPEAPARFDVGLEFLDAPAASRERLASVLRGP